MKTYVPEEKTVILTSNSLKIPNIYKLEKVGAGHDGLVFKHGDQVLKLLKYDIQKRKEDNLMTYEKACYFMNELNTKRLTIPNDILNDEDGIYSGYAMKYVDDLNSEKKKKENSPLYKEKGDFTCGEILVSAEEIMDDFSELTKKKVLAEDLNRGSYIYACDGIHICDLDKFIYRKDNSAGIGHLNSRKARSLIAKYFGFIMMQIYIEQGVDKKIAKKAIDSFVKEKSNDERYIQKLEEELRKDYRTPVSEYSKYLCMKM